VDATLDEHPAYRGVTLTDVDHYRIAEQLVGESVQGAGTMSGREVAKAQVHATLAVAEILRGLSAELALIRQAAQDISAAAPPG
jgi:endo-alpha-1,4-polygalactosaminidase (GH114 family)